MRPCVFLEAWVRLLFRIKRLISLDLSSAPQPSAQGIYGLFQVSHGLLADGPRCKPASVRAFGVEGHHPSPGPSNNCPLFTGRCGCESGSRILRRYSMPHARGAMRPKLCISLPSKKNQRAQGKPGTRCTRGLMCDVHQRMLHMSIQVQRRHSDFPCAVALRLIRVRPGDRLSCHHHL
jgi:hypothetical protein